MKRWLIAGIIIVFAAGGSLTWYFTHRSQSRVVPQQMTKSVEQAKTLDPLEIEAIRARTYTASQIVDEGSLRQQGEYTTRVVSYTSDSLKEYALLATPSTPKPAGGYPVILLLHGYIPPSQYVTDSNDYHDWIAAWARAGFVVIKPDYRGNGQSEGQPGSGHYSPDYTYDVLNLIASLKHYSLVDAKRIGVAGHSLGAHLALRTAVASGDVKATVVANGVVGTMYDFFYNWPHSPAPRDMPTTTVRAQLQELKDKHGDAKTNPDYWNKVSAINYVRYITGPVQINHDEGDSIVPILFSEHLSEAMKSAGKNVTFYRYPGDDHQFSSPANHQLVIQRMTDFFKANL